MMHRFWQSVAEGQAVFWTRRLFGDEGAAELFADEADDMEEITEFAKRHPKQTAALVGAYWKADAERDV